MLKNGENRVKNECKDKSVRVLRGMFFFIAMGGLGGFWHAFGVEGMWAAGGQLFVSARLRRRGDVDIVWTTVGCGGGLGSFCGALGSVCFQYVGLGREQFCQYIVSMLEYLGGFFGGYGEGVGIVWRGGGGVVVFLGRGLLVYIPRRYS